MFPYQGTWTADFDGDGLGDEEERRLGFSATSQDSSGTGHSDLAVARFGASPTNCNLDSRQDSDRDGLTDCDEQLLMTDPLKGDSDSDGGIDLWEVLHGFNPKNGQDLVVDSDNDGISNLEEMLQGSHPLDPASRTALFTQTLQMDDRGCWNLGIQNYVTNSNRRTNEYQFVLLEEQNGVILARSALISASTANVEAGHLLLDLDITAPPLELDPAGGRNP